MNSYQINIIQKLLRKPCPVRIPRTGDDGKVVNCYSISLYAGDTPLLLVDEVNNDGFVGSYFESNRFNPRASLPFALMYGVTIRIEHYHGLYTHVYQGVFDYCWHEWTGFYKVQSFLSSMKHQVPQFFFNKKTLQLPSRMIILEKAIAKQSVKPHKTFSSLDIMTYVYGMRWYLHPKKTEVKQKMELYLESFVASGELSSPSSFDYKVTGKAIATLEQYQIEIARAKSDLNNQRAIVVLTIILAIFTGFQAGIIKTSYYVNLDKVWAWVQSFI